MILLMSTKEMTYKKKKDMLSLKLLGSSCLFFFFYIRDDFSQRGREELAAKHILFCSVDRNNLFIVLFMATETGSQGIKHAHKWA